MKARLNDNFSFGDLIAEIGCLFLNKPYKEKTLENQDKEKLVFNLSAFDCTTFVETVIALAQCAESGNFSPTQFKRYLKSIRYRQGKIQGYSSRLHYFTGWLRDHEKMRILKDESKKLGGTPQRKKINFMTVHQEMYPALKNKTQLAKVAITEKNLSRRVFHVIGTDKISAQKTNIQDGNIIAFTTNEKGLDVAHVGFAIRQGKNLHLLHASKKEKRVVISEKTLAAYLKSNKQFTGIIVARVLEPC
ncbi:MAG: DUF1460 domain-containing protein [Syntrophaceae bacterium]|nr:DUF1460 domain-containing protein [Syntrophaceae bacterium]